MKILLILFAIGYAAIAGAMPPSECADGNAARSAVLNYLTAMHENRFDDAYDYVTEKMTDGRSRQDWSSLQARTYGPGKVQIYGVDVRQALAPEDDPGCADRAVVPNVLSSRDRLNEHGTVEFEIYRVLRDDHGWRVNEQETLFDDPLIEKWFPALAPPAAQP